MTEPPDAAQPEVPRAVPPEELPQAEAAAPALAEDDEVEEALAETNRLFGLLTLGIMALLLLCVVLVLIADRRAPVGL
jgi:hypothetical protein